jgi:phosphohistidine phosphatase SixA
VRAVQTAELLVRWLDWAGSIEATHFLAPGGASARATAEWLVGCAEALTGATLVAVGHEPSMSHLAGLLTGGGSVPSLRKAEACFIEDGALRWRLEPA